MIRVKDTLTSLEHVRCVFQNNKRAFYSRFGDGDVYIMMGRNQANHDASALLTKEMKEAFAIDDPMYMKGLAINHPREKGMVRGLFAVFKDNREMRSFLESTFNFRDRYTFENPIFLHYLSVFKPALVNTFLDEVIRPKLKMYIGSVPREKIEAIIGPIACYIETPAKNSYATIDSWWPQVLKNINDVELVIPATGMSSRIINKRLWLSGYSVQSFDIGSLVDVADRRQTRKWIRLAGHRVERYIIRPHQRLSLPETMMYVKKEIKLTLYKLIKQVSPK